MESEARPHNSTLAIGGVSSPLDSFVVSESSRLRTNFCAEKPALRDSYVFFMRQRSQLISFVFKCTLAYLKTANIF
jgi:hypothetical protein